MTRQLWIPPDKLPAPGSRSFVRDGDLSLALFSVNGELYALDDSCPHGGASLVMGKLDGFRVRCPAHGLAFDIRTGCMSAHGSLKANSYPVTVVNGQTFVTLPYLTMTLKAQRTHPDHHRRTQ